MLAHTLKSIEMCQALVAQVTGPAPATHLFICSGYILTDSAPGGFSREHPIESLSFILPDNDRGYLTLAAPDGSPLTLLSSTAFVAFAEDTASSSSKIIKGAQVSQQGAHAVLTIYLWLRSMVSVEDTLLDTGLAYQVSMLAGPAS